LARTRSVTTPIADYSIHHLAPELFAGFDGSPAHGYLAFPEKALFDSVYVRAPRGARMFFPELSLPEGFDRGRCEQWLDRIRSPRMRTLVSRGLGNVLEQATQRSAG
jgi:hypothetical protein